MSRYFLTMNLKWNFIFYFISEDEGYFLNVTLLLL